MYPHNRSAARVCEEPERIENRMLARQKRVAPVLKLAKPGLTHHQIVEGLQQGRSDCAMALYEQYSELINRLVWRILGADGEHDDVVQQVFLCALSSIHSLREPSALESWMVGITINTVKRELRNRTIRRIFHINQENPDLNLDPQTPNAPLIVRRFYQAVSELKPDDRIAFTLRFVEGYTLGETAVACGCSLATIKRRLAHAKRSFLLQAKRDPILVSWIEGGVHEP